MSLPISSRNSVLAVAGFCRMHSNGAMLVVILGLATKCVVMVFRSQLANVPGGFSTIARIVRVSFRVCAELNAGLHACHVTLCTMVENLLRDFFCNVCR